MRSVKDCGWIAGGSTRIGRLQAATWGTNAWKLVCCIEALVSDAQSLLHEKGCPRSGSVHEIGRASSVVFFLVAEFTPAKVSNADERSSFTALKQCALYSLASYILFEVCVEI